MFFWSANAAYSLKEATAAGSNVRKLWTASAALAKSILNNKYEMDLIKSSH